MFLQHPKNSMESNSNKEELELSTYFKSYLEKEPIQSAEKAERDSQLNTLALEFQEFFSKFDEGTIVDIGCGEGALLSYICGKTDFKMKKGWMFYAVDFENNLKKVNDLIFQLVLNRRVELIPLKRFYDTSMQALEVVTPIVLVCRNVMHELDIAATADLFTYLIRNPFDKLILQDLMNFKQGERGNVCWDNEILKNLLENIGFQVTIVPLESKSRAKWLNAVIKKEKEIQLSDVEIKHLIIDAKKEQYSKWTKEFSLQCDSQILTVDRDLQIAALASQLKKCEVEIKDYVPDSKVVLAVLERKFADFNGEIEGDEIKRVDDFRDRAHIQDELEKMLLEKQSRIQIVGGPKIGKTYLVNRLLSKRSYGKPVIFIDLMKTSNIWSVLEQFFEKIGLNISAKTFATLKKIDYDSIRKLVVDFLNNYGKNLIIVIHYLERVLTQTGEVEDKELRKFFQDITKSSVYSVLLLSRIRYRNKEASEYKMFPLSLFPEGKHVINVLDDYINRSEYNIEKYPEALLRAIGKHPYMAYMAAKIIKKRDIVVIDDEKFLDEIRLELHKELMKRLIDENTLSAIYILQYLRSPIPFKEAEGLCDTDSLRQCIEDGLIVEKKEYGEKVICCACDFGSTLLSIKDKTDFQIIERIGDAYETAYHRTDNPVYLRESIYYNICAGKRTVNQLGEMYMSEISAAANYWYRKRDFNKVVWACEFLSEAGHNNIEILILKASALMRIRNSEKVSEGRGIFSKNVNRNSPYSYKSKYIDSLLYAAEFEEAKAKLNELGFGENSCEGWQAYQYGCVYLGLQLYKKAISYLEKALMKNKQGVIYLKLARAYYCSGEFALEISILKKAYNYTRDSQIRLKYANALLRSAMKENVILAGHILSELYANDLKGDVNVAAIYCRYLCRTGEVSLANKVYQECSFDEKSKMQKQNMELDISMANRKWEKCEDIIENMDVDEDYKKGIQKRLYLYIARSDNSKKYAEKGLKVKIPSKYAKNIPFRLTHCSLAKFLGRVDILSSENLVISKINNSINVDFIENGNWGDVLADDFMEQ